MTHRPALTANTRPTQTAVNNGPCVTGFRGTLHLTGAQIQHVLSTKYTICYLHTSLWIHTQIQLFRKHHRLRSKGM